MIIIVNTFAAWIYFQRARDDDESFTRSIIGDSPSMTEFAETKTHVMLGNTRYLKFASSIRRVKRYCSKIPVEFYNERIVDRLISACVRWYSWRVSKLWWFHSGRIKDGWPEVRASRSVILYERKREIERERERERERGTEERRAIEDITCRRVRYTRAGLQGKIMPEEVGIHFFSSVSYDHKHKRRQLHSFRCMSFGNERDVSLEKPSLPSSSAKNRAEMSWFWLECRHAMNYYELLARI